MPQKKQPLVVALGSYPVPATSKNTEGHYLQQPSFKPYAKCPTESLLRRGLQSFRDDHTETRKQAGFTAVAEIQNSGDSVAFDESMLDHYSDSELALFARQSAHLITTRVEATKVLSDNLIANYVGPSCHDEISALQYARDLGIRVPVVHRLVVLNVETEAYLIIMERVHGRKLEQLWTEIGWRTTFYLGRQLKTYVQAMHKITSSKSGGLSSGSLRSPFFQGLYPPAPYSTPVAFTGYLNWWLVSCRPSSIKPRPDLSLKPLREHVFIHQDLAPRNMILDAQNQLWIIDWGYSGFYPPYLEYAGFEASAMPWLYAPS